MVAKIFNTSALPLHDWSKFLTSILLPLDLCLSTATRLRFPGIPFGVSEILLLVVLFINAPSIIIDIKNYKSYGLFYSFWGSLFLFGFLGLYCFNLPTVPHQFVEKDILAYGYVFLLSIFLLGKDQKIDPVLKTIIPLYILGDLAFISYDTFFQTKIFHPHGRFVGLSLNPNQVALTLAPLPFFCLHYAFEKTTPRNIKVFWTSLTLASFYIGIRNSSISIFFIWVFLGLSGVFLKFAYKKYQKLAFFILPAFLYFSYFSVSYLGAIWLGVLEEFEIRGYLLLETLRVLQDTFFLGSGFGSLVTHQGQAYEPHNTLMNIFLSSGVITGATAVSLLGITIKRLFKHTDFFIISAFLSVVLFSFAHSLMRHPIFWFYLIACYQMAKSRDDRVL